MWCEVFSGESHVARELGRILDIPVTHLDAVCFDHEWNALPMAAFEAARRELADEPAWVIDGNYNSTLRVRLETADTVIFMDVSTIAALWGVVSRQVRHGAGQNGDSVRNRIRWGVLNYVATYRRRFRVPRRFAAVSFRASG